MKPTTRDVGAAAIGFAVALGLFLLVSGRYQLEHTFGANAYEIDRWTGRMWYCRPTGCAATPPTDPRPSAAKFLDADTPK